MIYSYDDKLLFDKLYSKYNRLVYSVAYRYTHNVESAEDATQDTYMFVSQKLNMFKDIDEKYTKNLICTIARSAAISQYKKELKNALLSEKMIIDSDEELYEEINAFNSDDIKKALNKLSEREQNIITLKFYYGITNDEIAEIYKIKKSWASQLTTGALKKLRNILGDDYKNE